MDVTCANCREPWDTYHMHHDEVWETDLIDDEKKHFQSAHLAREHVRKAFERNGWKFAGNSVVAILRCPCCPKNAEHNGEPDAEAVKDREMKRNVLADLLGDDEDGLACMLEDLDMLEG